MNEPLTPLREQIDALDTQILELLNRRARVVVEVGEIKKLTNSPVYRPEREAQVLASLVALNPGPLPSASVQVIFREVMSACRALERRVSVAYLGPVGTYSEQAMLRQFGQAIDAIPCASIDEVFRTTETGGADFGVVPVENSTEGVISRTLDLLLQTPLKICAEVALPIHHCLLTRSGKMEGIERICAHPQALAQCLNWLTRHYPNIERVAVSSNGEAARLAGERSDTAAVAGETAGKLYELTAVATQIQDEQDNVTRFAVLGNLITQTSGRDHTSLVVSVANQPGAVHTMLAPLANHGVSMTRFESRPNRSRSGDNPWTYYFYIDIEGHESDVKVAPALAELKALAGFFKVLGSYPSS